MTEQETAEKITIGKVYQDRSRIGDGISLAKIFCDEKIIGIVQRTKKSWWARREIIEEQLFDDNSLEIRERLRDIRVK
jgi:hypothetical protein